MKYLLTGGGTGGHVYPALAIADELRRKQPDAEFLYVGVRNKLEDRVVPGRGYTLRYVRSRPFPRAISVINLGLFCLNLVLGVIGAFAILLRFRPDVVIGTGGFVSAPVMFAFCVLRKLGISSGKIFLYEPNSHPGLLNHVIGRFADRIGVAFEQAGRWFDMRRVAIVGYPVRREFLQLDRIGARQRLGFGKEKHILIVVGGSQGSRAINQAVVDVLPRMRIRENLVVIHVTGPVSGGEYDPVADTQQRLDELGLGADGDDPSDWYIRVPYAEKIEDLYAAADVVVCRGGAATLIEINVCGLPAVVVPLSSSSEDHQAINARELQKRGAVLVVYQEAAWDGTEVETKIDSSKLADAIEGLLDSTDDRRRMSVAAQAINRHDGLETICSEIENLAAGKRPLPLSLEFPLGDVKLPSDPNELIEYVRDRITECGGVKNIPQSELAYLRYQADRLLSSHEWYEIPLGKRNVGVKLVGYLKHRDRLDLLLSILQDRQARNAFDRLLGGDFIHPGILRRNIVQIAFRELGVASEPAVEKILLQILERDPYFEVRAAAAALIGEAGKASDMVEATLTKALSDRSKIVVANSIRALGMVGLGSDLTDTLRKFYQHSDWQLRHAVVITLQNLLERKVIDPKEVAIDIDLILATTPNFDPVFPLKQSLIKLAQMITTASDSKISDSDVLHRV